MTTTGPSKTVRDGVGSLLRRLRGDEISVLTHQTFSESCPQMVKRCCAKLRLAGGDKAHAVSAITNFATLMSNTEKVIATGFLETREPKCPSTLTVVVLAELEEQGEYAGKIVMQVSEAHEALRESVSGVMPSGLRFVNVLGMELGTAWAQLREQWHKDPSVVRILPFIAFDRR